MMNFVKSLTLESRIAYSCQITYSRIANSCNTGVSELLTVESLTVESLMVKSLTVESPTVQSLVVKSNHLRWNRLQLHYRCVQIAYS